jgi:hypothetical protein
MSEVFIYFITVWSNKEYFCGSMTNKIPELEIVNNIFDLNSELEESLLLLDEG